MKPQCRKLFREPRRRRQSFDPETRTWLAVGKSSGIGMVTLPVAAHSVPRSIDVRKPTQRIAVVSSPMAWPITVVKTRPLP